MADCVLENLYPAGFCFLLVLSADHMALYKNQSTHFYMLQVLQFLTKLLHAWMLSFGLMGSTGNQLCN